jgi:hypothetical protein
MFGTGTGLFERRKARRVSFVRFDVNVWRRVYEKRYWFVGSRM